MTVSFASPRPLALDLYTGLHGWAEGLIAAGWRVIGIDIEDMCATLGEPLPPEHFELVIQDVLTVNGADYAEAQLIVGSSPCTKYSYMAMPWTRSKALAAWYRDPEHPERLVELNALYDAQFRIQREASDAAGRHIPLVVENVRGAIPWIGRSRANFGSYHLWGDVPALMPIAAGRGVKVPGMGAGWVGPDDPRHRPGLAFNPAAQGARVRAELDAAGRKLPGFRFDGSGGSFQSAAVSEHITVMKPPARVSAEPPAPGRKGAGAGAGAVWFDQNTSSLPSASPRRKAASAKIAKIPFTLARWIGRAWLPREASRIALPVDTAGAIA